MHVAARSNVPGSISPGCSAVSPPIRAQPASRQPSATPLTRPATSCGCSTATAMESRGRPAFEVDAQAAVLLAAKGALLAVVGRQDRDREPFDLDDQVREI